MTKNPEVRFAKSIVDYIFRWMATKFLSPEAQYRAGVNLREEPEADGAAEADGASKAGGGGRATGAGSTVVSASRTEVRIEATVKKSEFGALRNQEDAPPCSTCGSIMIRSGSCYKCGNCGTTSGCA
jgi:ribonucleoside-diphosphate reductase alpha chain